MKYFWSILLAISPFLYSGLACAEGGSLKATTKTPCAQVLAKKYPDQIISHGASADFIHKISDTMMKIDRLSAAADINMAQGSFIHVVGEMSPRTDWGGPRTNWGIIRTPEIFMKPNQHGGTYSSHPKHSLAIFAHEYGHNVFLANISRFVPISEFIDFDEAFALSQFYFLHSEAAMETLNRLQEEAPSLQELEENPHYQEFQALMDLAKEARGLQPPPWLKEQKSPYEELFADVVAVIVMDDPRAVWRAIHQPFAPDKTRGRDFSQNHPLESWNKNGAHLKLSPFRSYLWNNYLNNPTYKGSEPKILRNLLIAIGLEIKKLAETENRELSPPQANRQLIETFEHVMFDDRD